MRALQPLILLGLVALGTALSPLPGRVSTPTPSTTTEAPKEASYWVTYNKKVRPGQTMSFTVLILKGNSPVTVKASLFDYDGKVEIYMSEEVNCYPGVTQTVTIEIPYNPTKPSENRWQNYYMVRVNGTGAEVQFAKEGRADLQDKAFSVFVQTDKAMYKPRDNVKFRILSVTPKLQMMREAEYDIVIEDSKGNSIRSYRNVKAFTNMGVVEKDFTLADKPPTGDWKINVNVLGMTESKTFTVSDYVLPKFEVKVDGPPFGLLKEDSIEYVVKAMYTFGKPVTDSNVTVEIKTTGYSWYYRPGSGKFRQVIRKDGQLNEKGEFVVQLQRKNLLRLVRDYNPSAKNVEWQDFIINATVTEARTFKNISATKMFEFYASPIKMNFLSITQDSFKPGLFFTAYLEVRKRDDSLFTPEEAKDIKVNFKAEYDIFVPYTKTEAPPSPPTTATTVSTGTGVSSPPRLIAPRKPAIDDVMYPNGGYNPPQGEQRRKQISLTPEDAVQTLPDNGWLLIRFSIPDDAISISIEANTNDTYARSSSAYFYADEAQSPTESFLQLNVTNHKPKVGDVVHVKAKATELMKTLNYQLSSKGTNLFNGRYIAAEPSKEIDFEFTIEKGMAPNLNLLAFFVKEDGEFVVDALSLSIDGIFESPLEVKFSKKIVKPGEQVDVIVKGKEESFVFLLAVDKSVKLLKSGNDITQDLVRQELLKYEYGNYFDWRYMFICGWPSYFGGSDAHGVFESAGVTVLTDGNVYRNLNYYMGPVMFSARSGASGGPEMMEDTMSMPGPTKSLTPASRVRKLFPENWLWNAWIIPSNGEVSFSLTAPDTITTWIASAFSAHPTEGLSVGAEPAEVTTFRDLFISLDLPTSIIRNEEFCFTASVFSYYKGDVMVMLRFARNPDIKQLYTVKDGGRVKVEAKSIDHTILIGTMKDGDIDSVMFCFTPTEVLGDVKIRVSALTNIKELSDAVERTIHVKPEGVPRTTSKPMMVDLENGLWERNVAVTFPPQTVQGSEKIYINVAGNFLGPVFENMDDLVKQPYGCGEQNMINFSPLMSLMKFFLVTNTITEELQKKITGFMANGLSKELKYEHELEDGTMTGGYSTFGDGRENKGNASTWLTAFVMKSFAQARGLDDKYGNVLDVDLKAINRSVMWLASKQERSGAFVEYGKVFNKRLQGDAGDGEPLTAYSLIAMHQASLLLNSSTDDYKRLQGAMRAGLRFLEDRMDYMKDPYDVCITAYALHLLDSRWKDVIFNKMEMLAQSGSGLKYWEREEKEPADPYVYYWTKNSNALAVEMTSYALLTYHNRGIASSKGLSIINWLSNQKNEKGGFYSTQDTVIAIEALTTVAALLHEAEFIKMTIKVTAGNDTKSFDMVKANEMLLQKFELPVESAENGIFLEAVAENPVSDISTVLIDVVLDYNVQQESQNNVFKMEYEVGDNYIDSKISTVNGKLAGMSILEVDLSLGYTVDIDDIIESNDVISKAELKTPEGPLVLYFQTDSIGPRGVKLRLPLEQSGGVAISAKPRYLKLYAYYEPESDLVVRYSMHRGTPFCTKAPQFGVCPFN